MAKSGRVIRSVTVSLDGFIAGPDDEMDRVFQYDGPNPLVEELIHTTGMASGFSADRMKRQPT